MPLCVLKRLIAGEKEKEESRGLRGHVALLPSYDLYMCSMTDNPYSSHYPPLSLTHIQTYILFM